MKKNLAILSFWPFPEDLLAKIKSAAPNHEIIDLSNEHSDAQLANVEIAFGNIDPKIISKMLNLKWLHTETSGVEGFLNLPENILLTNSSGAYGISIAEHMLGFTLMLLRNSPGYVHQQREHIWQTTYSARNLYNCNVLVIGLGDIGGRYAFICHTMGAKVNGVVRTPRNTKPEYVNKLYTTDQRNEAVKDADIIALALPGTGETTGILSRELLSATKKGALIINIGRGSAIDQPALIELLQSGHLGGAALDVTTPEPLPQDNPLWDMPNVIITPHISYGGRDNTSGLVIERFTRYLKDYQNGKPFERVVDRGAGY